MAPDKLEQEFRRKLQQREIQPAGDSWNRLEERLATKKARSKSHVWMTGVAAVFAGLIFMAGYYFRGPVVLENPVIVNVPAEEEIENDLFSEGESAVAEEKSSEKVNTPASPTNRTEIRKSTSEAQEKSIASGEIQPELLPEQIPQEEKNRLLKNDNPGSSSSEIASVTDEEIEALLFDARAQLQDHASVQVNPEALLTEVEDELDQRFRDRVFDVIKEGLSRAKTAVANSDF